VARRSGLGQGLGALIPTEVVGDRSSALREVPIGSIKPNPLQPRSHFDDETMASLASSIKELGVLQPILVRQIGDEGADEFELIAGERRWRAARRAGLQTIPVLIQVTDEAHSLEQALVENLHRQDLNVLEEASAYQQLIEEFDYTHDEVATRVGKSRTAVTNTLRLLQLPSGAQRLLAEGQISPGHARALLGTPDRGYQEALAKSIVADGLTVRAPSPSSPMGCPTSSWWKRPSRPFRLRRPRRLRLLLRPGAYPHRACSSWRNCSRAISTPGSRST
jgi:ParB family chromosome partitioning protein